MRWIASSACAAIDDVGTQNKKTHSLISPWWEHETGTLPLRTPSTHHLVRKTEVLRKTLPRAKGASYEGADQPGSNDFATMLTTIE